MEKLLRVIYKIRQQKNFSQTYVAMQMGISQKQYSYLESGKTHFKLMDLIRVAHILEINPCDLLELSGLLAKARISEKDKTIEKQTILIDKLSNKVEYIELVNRKLLQL